MFCFRDHTCNRNVIVSHHYPLTRPTLHDLFKYAANQQSCFTDIDDSLLTCLVHLGSFKCVPMARQMRDSSDHPRRELHAPLSTPDQHILRDAFYNTWSSRSFLV
ncbi:uncharacterized protein MYCFIDRAFT_173751 [Pseudocercospora fijiensis CIRAD86]|uniref:Uncharacterized protein n=1 Tax=Pseudocercospora fijiensis (strain CIRAD86) TaxID=383855 RepID=M3AJV3_PSEFD|nr:uncharacterized protein MYCFIDRAFT_173751 [Pseudocercospora fijiensis CIRAD86]EME84846.1 hypothetical protein MYCFIDRAFT_173751 [Pseudocercospora fijiensis CIRAD86]